MTVSEIFDTMEYGPAPESAAEALAWLVDQGDRFGHFINGEFVSLNECRRNDGRQAKAKQEEPCSAEELLEALHRDR